jgi:hypothetical protein
MKKKEFNAKKWFIKCLAILIAVVFGAFLLVWIFDPYFHFHKPFSFVSYRLYNERYTNDGISRHFDYDTIITGTSMSQNFKTSEADELFDAIAVKESFSGAAYKELSENLDRALSRHDVKNVIWTMDFNSLIRDKDYSAYNDYPTYLYDDNPWNDVSYVFNKDIWYHGVLTNILWTLTGHESTSFDDYSSWDKETGYEYIMDSYDRWEEKADMEPGLDDESKEMVSENIRQNFVDLVSKYPDTTFYIFYTPYSIVWWDFMNQEGMMMWQFDAELISTELLLQCPNVKLYNFNDKYDIITNLDNYRDKEHYSSEINSKILEWIANGDGLVTNDNYLELLQKEKEYYLNYDYGSIFR